CMVITTVPLQPAIQHEACNHAVTFRLYTMTLSLSASLISLDNIAQHQGETNYAVINKRRFLRLVSTSLGAISTTECTIYHLTPPSSLKLILNRFYSLVRKAPDGVFLIPVPW
ncbi:hypothetical protein J6590_086022, partial [Homalodisca vitripennis]